MPIGVLFVFDWQISIVNWRVRHHHIIWDVEWWSWRL